MSIFNECMEIIYKLQRGDKVFVSRSYYGDNTERIADCVLSFLSKTDIAFTNVSRRNTDMILEETEIQFI